MWERVSRETQILLVEIDPVIPSGVDPYAANGSTQSRDLLLLHRLRHYSGSLHAPFDRLRRSNSLVGMTEFIDLRLMTEGEWLTFYKP
jgi:hypothetical protein